MSNDEVLEKLKVKGVHIAYKDRIMRCYDDNMTWVVTAKPYKNEPRTIFYCGLSYHEAFKALLYS
jgi:hypothetical protein